MVVLGLTELRAGEARLLGVVLAERYKVRAAGTAAHEVQVIVLGLTELRAGEGSRTVFALGEHMLLTSGVGAAAEATMRAAEVVHRPNLLGQVSAIAHANRHQRDRGSRPADPARS